MNEVIGLANEREPLVGDERIEGAELAHILVKWRRQVEPYRPLGCPRFEILDRAARVSE